MSQAFKEIHNEEVILLLIFYLPCGLSGLFYWENLKRG